MDFEIGQLVRSLAGRDKERLYVIIGFEEDRALLSDGRYRPLDKPKKKNFKHLQPYSDVFNEIREKLQEEKLNDTLIRNILNNVIYSQGSSEQSIVQEN